jgi:hypothetical protein
MGHQMFDYDAQLTDIVFAYCRERLSMDPVPLDYGSQLAIPSDKLAGLIRPEGRDPKEILDFFETTLAPAVVSIDSPGFLAFIPNAPTKNSLLFDMVVACSGLNGTSWLESSGVVVAENQALTFLADTAGLPESSGGAFVSGGSIGNLSSLTVARDVGRAKHPELNPRDVRFAISSDAHSSIGKALHVLDVDTLVVETDDHRFTLPALEAALANDPHPENVIGVVATAGTTNAGIVDDLEGLGSYAREHELWFHIDGAYGGAAIFSATHRHLFEGIRHADSFIVDPHKWLFAPLDCCALIYRNPTVARKVLAQQASYLDVLHGSSDDDYEWNPSDFGIHLSRRARGLPFGSRSSRTDRPPTSRQSKSPSTSPNALSSSSKRAITWRWCAPRASPSSSFVAAAGMPGGTTSGVGSFCVARSPSLRPPSGRARRSDELPSCTPIPPKRWSSRFSIQCATSDRAAGRLVVDFSRRGRRERARRFRREFRAPRDWRDTP